MDNLKLHYKPYQHVEKIGRDEVEGLLNGKCYIQPKIDGTNSLLWLEDDKIHAGSRKRELTLIDDNAGFYCEIIRDENIKKYLIEHPYHYLYGEWLVPHSIKTYNDEAWKKFYIFDVYDLSTQSYLPFDVYSKELDKYELEYIPCLAVMDNPTLDDLIKVMKTNHYLMPNDLFLGEGVVVKRYDFTNKYGRTIWGKIVAEEFFQRKKDNHIKKVKIEKANNEDKFVETFVTDAVIKKEFYKIVNDSQTAKLNVILGRTLSAVYEAVIKEDLPTFILKNKKAQIDFGIVKYKTEQKTKDLLRKEKLLDF